MTNRFQKGDIVTFKPGVVALTLQDQSDIGRHDALRLISQRNLLVKDVTVDEGRPFAILSEETTWGYAMYAVPEHLLMSATELPNPYVRIAAVIGAIIIAFLLAALFGLLS